MMSKVSSLSLENFGVIPLFDCNSFSRINLIIGDRKNILAESIIFDSACNGGLSSWRRCKRV